ncbi:hypothetical protein BAG01nite_16970 [Brevibacillus agri]|uniref:DUF4179 domain-containing protein n=1 Tax=Brevibacillus agri TaxID=51101 RepID=A0A3M8AW41_9BACL|nr:MULTISPECIES: hypothetical protein [Brevibacillus]EJL43560.1 hypothetical protein PMI08_02573 [Brevibacillus sp. CF112]MCG5254365.1 hypothetical protein [Brevibacillus agri]QAV15278.1 hypothetical protein BA6348_22410 [Brevibacillus agri]QHZ57946.1 hypothetical protein M655_021060 [Brevibacillus sp. NSP2.1]RNB55379.1 hypothetical protein EB820_11635 [Brevibacillus agri]
MNNWNKIVTGTLLTSVLFTGQALTADAASTGSATKDLQALAEKTADVTGDKKADTITLYGKKDKNSPYISALTVKVTDGQTKKSFPIDVKDGGYEPKLSVQDFTYDKKGEIMVTANTGGSGGYTIQHIYTVQNGKAEKLSLPGLDKDKQGIVGDGFVELKPIDNNKNGLYVLEGTERLTGDYNADVRGYLKSKWKWSQSKWELMSAHFEPTKAEKTVYQGSFRSYDSAYDFLAPQSWNGNILIDEKTGPHADPYLPEAKSVTSFLFNSSKAEDQAAVVVIYAFDKSDWKKLNTPNEPPVGYEIAQNPATNTVYVAALPQDSVFDPATDKGKKFQSLVMTLDEVKKAFVLVKR